MLKLLYKPVAIVAGIVGGLLSGLIFKRAWKIVGRGSQAPAPMDSERGWGEILLAQVCMARIRAGQNGCRPWRRRVDAKKTEIWPTGRLSNLTSRLTTAKLKPPSMRPGHRAAPELVIYSAAISAR